MKAKLKVLGRLGPAAAVLLPAAAVAPFLVVGFSPLGMDISGLAPVKSVMSMLEARSPGERPEGAQALAKLKAAKAKAKVAQALPKQRALGKVFSPPKPEEKAFTQAITPPAPPETPVIAEAPTLAEAVLPSSAPLIASAPGVLLPAIIGGVGGGGGGGGGGLPGGGGGDVGNTPPVVPVIPAVPEPGTWLMMLLGFGVIGSVMRRRNPATRGKAFA